MNESTEIRVPSDPKYLCVVRAVAEKMGELHGMDAAEKSDVTHAVDEACSNVIKYAYNGDAAHEIVVKFELTEQQFQVIIEDNGVKAEPELVQGRKLDDVRPGGLGVHLIKKAFDVVEFDTAKKKGNRLRLIRYRKDTGKNNED